NIASEAALRGNAAGAAYTASKHAVVGLTKNTAFMYGHRGIRVNAVAPGGVATGIAAGGGPVSEWGRERTAPFLRSIPPIATAAQLAASITFLLSDDGVNVNGAILPSDGGWSVQGPPPETCRPASGLRRDDVRHDRAVVPHQYVPFGLERVITDDPQRVQQAADHGRRH